MFKLIYLILFCFVLVKKTESLVDGIYCGEKNCYDVLEIPRDATEKEVAKAYRKLAKIYHPDKHIDQLAKKEAEVKFLEITTAYDVLKEEESRKDYDYMLDNPEEMYRHYWRYYKRKVKVDVRIVIIFTITIVSVIKYFADLSKYNEAINYFLNVPKYRNKAQEIAKSEGLLQSSNSLLKKKNRHKTKDQIKREENLILRSIIEEKLDVRGSYSKPTVYDILWVQIIFLPYQIYKFIIFYVIWFYKYKILKLDYEDKDKHYIIRKNLKLSQCQWDQLDDEEKEDYMFLELWKSDKFEKWKKQEDEKNKAKLAESSSYKRYRRWMKKGGPGSISFIDD